ncbi:65-kDa microtubule-associated protein 1-like protein, partial [Tanacetum coccineum]
MTEADVQNPLLGETTCSSLLLQLQIIWDEVGESDEERDASSARARVLECVLADAKLKFSTLLASLGDKSSVSI